ncbi:MULTISPECIES: copper resistance D family protein [Massilia]|uniref:Copper resistance protein CopD n=2 Tax=Massilia TaxID=149698 RepID=A0A5C7G2B3_9BURK|nr:MULTISPECIES: CopD family protein [Massilia]TXF98372.1 copper resistance protein CopD [Massilia arenae]
MESDLALIQRAATVVLNLSVATLVGAGAASLWLSRASSPWATGMLPRLRKAMLVGLAVAISAYVATLWLEAASMAEVPIAEALPAVQSVITATHYGYAWILGAAALIVAGIGTAVASGRRGLRLASILRLGALALFLYSRSIVSHAGAGGDFTWAVAVDWVHLVLISLWVGEVIVAGLIVLRAEPDAGQANRTESARYVEALSTSATIALIGIFVTGILSAWRGLGSPDQVFGNPYGTVLLIKVGLVFAAAALGGMNRFIVMPGLLAQLRRTGATDRATTHKFALVLQIEAVILLAVIVAAAILSSTSPPMAS